MSRNNNTPPVDEAVEEASPAAKVYALTLDLKQAKGEKKVAMRALSEEIKRIQAEIDEVLNEETPNGPETAV